MTIPSLRFPVGSQVVPGDRLGSIRENLVPSNGTYEQGGHLYASVVGILSLDDAVVKGKSKKRYHPVRVEHPNRNPPGILRVGHVVLGRVTRMAIQQVFVDILAREVELSSAHKKDIHQEANLLFSFGQGTIRREDVRSSSTDQIKMHEMFQPHDLVLCRILSMGDRRLVLGTAEPALGVIRAFSSGTKAPMIPINWKEMKCPITGVKELRKCAKPPDELLSQLVQGETS